MPPIEQNGAMINADALARVLRSAGATRVVSIDGAMDSPGSLARAIQSIGGPALGSIRIDGGMTGAADVQRALMVLGIGSTLPLGSGWQDSLAWNDSNAWSDAA